MAEILSPEQAAERLFASDDVQIEWFANQGLASAVPRVVTDLREELGAFHDVRSCSPKCTARFERGEFTFDIAIDSNGLISSLWIDPPVVYSGSLDEAVEKFSSLPGKLSVYITRDDVPLAGINGDAPLDVGSAFKLAVLKALDTLIGAGKLEWNQVVELEDSWRSLPSGQLQDWPSGAPVTLHTLASLMISVSDNTATDALIDIVGRGSVETVSPRNRPFLTTREFFLLKRRGSENLRQQFGEGDFDDKMNILATLIDAQLPSVGDLNTDPLLEIEWFFTTEELCQLIGDLQHLDVLQINPGVALKTDWKQVAFKGGGDFGVMNLTTALTDKNGTRYCVSATWNNNEPLDETTFSMLYAGVLHQLK